MEMNYSKLFLSNSEVSAIVKGLYNIEGTAIKLDGELDLNFKIECNNSTAYILKISRPGTDLQFLNFQQALLQHAALNAQGLEIPSVIKDKNMASTSQYVDSNGQLRYVRLLSWIDGRLWSSVRPQTDALRYSLGQKAGLLTKALEGFEHPMMTRKLDWDNQQVAWVFDYLDIFEGPQHKLMNRFHQLIKAALPGMCRLRQRVVHNDLNDNNILVSHDLRNPAVITAIDFGDAIKTALVHDLGIAAMYLPVGQQDPIAALLPFVKGYHSSVALQAEELDYLYISVAIRLVISLTKAAINQQNEPENTYHQISTKGAWDLLQKWAKINPDFARYSFRQACGFSPCPQQQLFETWAQKQTFKISNLFPNQTKHQIKSIDLSVESTFVGHINDIDDIDLMKYRFATAQKKAPDSILAGGYLEARACYTSDAFKMPSNQGHEYRTIHLGTDFWLPAGTPIASFMEAKVYAFCDNDIPKDYGPTVILEHQYAEGECFYSLYGHLNRACLKELKIGQEIASGEVFAQLGASHENGGWIPHLHFQILLNTLGHKHNFPGVARPSEQSLWASICPDPNCLFQLDGLQSVQVQDNESLIEYRKNHLGKGLSLQYKVPIKMVRGDGVYLMDQYGQKYLDTVNNVAHVGHEHPAVVRAGQEQMALINTNSRYLHNNINAFAAELLETLPQELSVLHFVNSGSEANELALRMLKTATGQTDIIASEVGYHGNTNACVDISSYKFDGKGGQGAPDGTHLIPLPDTFRGMYKGTTSGLQYAHHVQEQINKIEAKGKGVAGFIIEPIISCGGQIELPKDFLGQAYKYVRQAGGYCISDEVQVGCGRVGKVFWGFQLYGVVPDIVTIGKPLGNGHPLAAVACTRQIADKFANGMEFFNTFGGNPVSCAIGKAVLQTVKQEKLQENALKVGEYLKKGLIDLSKKYPIIADVRGQGLFLGFELCDQYLNPLPEKVRYLANRMKEMSVLMSVDGPQYNVLKIKPPMVFRQAHADELLEKLSKVLKEDYLLQGS